MPTDLPKPSDPLLQKLWPTNRLMYSLEVNHSGFKGVLLFLVFILEVFFYHRLKRYHKELYSSVSGEEFGVPDDDDVRRGYHDTR